jgi:hypothetical protein
MRAHIAQRLSERVVRLAGARQYCPSDGNCTAQIDNETDVQLASMRSTLEASRQGIYYMDRAILVPTVVVSALGVLLAVALLIVVIVKGVFCSAFLYVLALVCMLALSVIGLVFVVLANAGIPLVKHHLKCFVLFFVLIFLILSEWFRVSWNCNGCVASTGCGVVWSLGVFCGGGVCQQRSRAVVAHPVVCCCAHLSCRCAWFVWIRVVRLLHQVQSLVRRLLLVYGVSRTNRPHAHAVRSRYLLVFCCLVCVMVLLTGLVMYDVAGVSLWVVVVCPAIALVGLILGAVFKAQRKKKCFCL